MSKEEIEKLPEEVENALMKFHMDRVCRTCGTLIEIERDNTCKLCNLKDTVKSNLEFVDTGLMNTRIALGIK